MCTKCFLKVSWKLEVASKRQFDLRVDNFHMIFSCFIFSFSIYILAVKPIKTGINPIWHGGPYDPPARKLAGLRFVSVFMSVCRYVCFSAQTMWVLLIGPLGKQLVQLLVWECDVFKCFPRGQPRVGLLSRNALRCEISLWFLFWFDWPTRNHDYQHSFTDGKKVTMFYDVKAYIYRVYRSLQYEVDLTFCQMKHCMIIL